MSKPSQPVSRDNGGKFLYASMLQDRIIAYLHMPMDSNNLLQALLIKYFNSLHMAFDGSPCLTAIAHTVSTAA